MPNELRQPRLSVQLNGLELPGVLAADVYSNNHFSADRFQIRLAAQVAPETALQTPGQRINVQLSVDGLSRSMIIGVIDGVSLDPIGGIISVEGRDLSASLIEAQINETFPNRTSSEIAQLLAGRHNLGALVQRTTTPIGRYYQSERDRVTLGQFARTTTEWDLLSFLAAQEGFDLYMNDDELYFGLPAIDTAMVLRISDCIGIDMQRCLPMSRPMQITVKSWSSKSAVATVGTASSAGVGVTWARELTRPNLSSDDAQRVAQRSLNDLKRHEFVVNVTMPGELTLTSRSQVAIVGSGTSWDRTYSVNKVTRHLDIQRGFTQRLVLQGIV